MKSKIEYTHNGSFWKSLWLLIRSFANIGAFGFFWYSLIASSVLLITVSSIVLALMVLLNFIFPLLKK